jgi:hypothetical protein
MVQRVSLLELALMVSLAVTSGIAARLFDVSARSKELQTQINDCRLRVQVTERICEQMCAPAREERGIKL